MVGNDRGGVVTPPYSHVVERMRRVIRDKDDRIALALACLLARGHLLIEDHPGMGKTTLAQGLALCLGLGFRRVQFTSDMLPGDVLGVSMPTPSGREFVFHPGPVFTNVLLVDEINRATPKTQSALLEAMEENQVSMDGQTRPLEQPFFVVATQNPLEYAGTYPLPESQLDRFLMCLDLGYPGREAEMGLLADGGARHLLADMEPCPGMPDVEQARRQAAATGLSRALLDYIMDLLEFTRVSDHFHIGLSPRAGLGLAAAAKAWAHIHGRAMVLPEDVQAVLPFVAVHRLRARDTLDALPAARLAALLAEVPVP